jgi:hypothetical protein
MDELMEGWLNLNKRDVDYIFSIMIHVKEVWAIFGYFRKIIYRID